MRATAVLQATRIRLRNPLYWAVILVLGAFGLLVPWTLGLGIAGHHLLLVLSPLYWSLVSLMVLPMAWQWTGSARGLASLPRGLAQAFLWTALWGLPMVGLHHALPRGEKPHPGGFEEREPGQHHPAGPLGYNPKPILGVVSYMGLGLLVSWLLAHKERAEAAAGTAWRVAAEARMRLLQSQMNPHVLFNAISALAELVREDPEAAERSLLDLSGFLRDLLDYGTQDSAPLRREREIVLRYLALEGLRLGKRLRVEWDWDEGLQDLEVPPLTLQPLVENAIKHGVSPARAGGVVRITLACGPRGACLEVANTGQPPTETPGAGLGLGHLRERLAFARPGATFRLAREGEWTRARLELGGEP